MMGNLIFIHTLNKLYKSLFIKRIQIIVNIPNPINHSYIHSFIRQHIHTFVHSYVHTSIRSYVNTFIRQYVHTSVRSYVSTFIHQYVHTVRWPHGQSDKG